MKSDTSVSRFDPASPGSGLDAVLAAVSAFRRTDTVDARGLNECIDIDAINLLFGKPGRSTTGLGEGALSFRYDDVFVTMTHDGYIRVVDADAFYTGAAPDGRWSRMRSQHSRESSLNVAAAALTEAEEHIWTVANNAADGEPVDPLWTAVEQLWEVQSSITTVSQSSPTGSLTLLSDDHR